MKKYLLMSLLIAAAMLMLAACGSKASDNTNAGSGVEETGTAASANIVIKAKRYEFDQPVYKIKKGEPTQITLENEDGVHNIEVPDLDLTVNSGKPKVVTINDAGEYEFHCDILCGSGHSKMIGKIVVE
ncbi:cupredoxin domain-containing protein [Paenibacillus montanisoli]|uniref:Cytochrome C oxidase subunit II n=1 Tax=Paenibacillus montanisoli TaxID=2081970 RepID=A0A328U3Z7_9BACL|nr:cupredoxin domain-containing protein [Paenibacillus montanisoli]RAP77349.1 cytochrome C oxidase subunit II [Paenibacillus montanisoli]